MKKKVMLNGLLIVVFLVSVFLVASISFKGSVISINKQVKLADKEKAKEEDSSEEKETEKEEEKEEDSLIRCENTKEGKVDLIKVYRPTAKVKYDSTTNSPYVEISINPQSGREKTTFYVSNAVKARTADNPKTITDSNNIVSFQEEYYRVESTASAKDLDGLVVTNKNPVNIPTSLIRKLGLIDDDDAILIVTFKATKEDTEPLCKGTAWFEIAIEGAGRTVVKKTIAATNVPTITLSKDLSPTIDCEHPTTDFEKDFCSKPVSSDDEPVKVTKFPTIDLGRAVKISEKLNKNNTYDSALKCDYKNISQIGTNAGDAYYKNEAHFSAKNKITYNPGQYVFHLAPAPDAANGEIIKKQTISYEIECTENVKIQFGPPVAAKAGLCFEYNVKATSYVSCKATGEVKPPKSIDVCTPIPQCYHPNSDTTGYQAGPNDDFDKCIKDCDGGKYTTKCSVSCYKKVYGTSKGKTSLLKSSTNKMATNSGPLNRCINLEKNNTVSGESKYTFIGYPQTAKGASEFYGCYYWKNDEIFWKSGTSGNIFENAAGSKEKTVENSPGRWYHEKRPNNNQSLFSVNGDGFFRKRFDSGLCSAICTWEACNKNEYLNPAQARADLDANMKKYYAAVAAAEAASSCSVRQSHFTIKVNGYNTRIDKKEDTLSSEETGKNIAKNEKLKGLYYVKDYSGCYQSSSLGSDNRIKYQTVWGFPGTWINNKTNEVKYGEPDGSGWQKIEHKFCLPLDATPVNQRLWTYYYTKNFKDKSNSSYSTSSTEYEDICFGETTNTTETHEKTCLGWVHDLNDNEEVNYNITASAIDFGYFGWTFDVSCFYAYAKAPVTCTDTVINRSETIYDSWPDECKPGMKVRSIDLKDVFPRTDGNEHDADTAGRTPGFNWSVYATNTFKNPNYASDPVSYMKLVQQRGDLIFDSDDQLDYRINLTKEDIGKIRNKIRGNNNTNGNASYNGGGTFSQVNGITTYKSDLIRKELTGNNKVPDLNLLGCNNIENDRCMEIK